MNAHLNLNANLGVSAREEMLNRLRRRKPATARHRGSRICSAEHGTSPRLSEDAK